MNLFLDTNVIIDIISARDGYEDSLNVLRCCEAQLVSGAISSLTILNAMYILRKHTPFEDISKSLKSLYLIVGVMDVLKADTLSAFSSDISDYEDAVQFCCALRFNADYIVTRNVRDFSNSAIEAILPSDVLRLMSPKLTKT